MLHYAPLCLHGHACRLNCGGQNLIPPDRFHHTLRMGWIKDNSKHILDLLITNRMVDGLRRLVSGRAEETHCRRKVQFANLFLNGRVAQEFAGVYFRSSIKRYCDGVVHSFLGRAGFPARSFGRYLTECSDSASRLFRQREEVRTRRSLRLYSSVDFRSKEPGKPRFRQSSRRDHYAPE